MIAAMIPVMMSAVPFLLIFGFSIGAAAASVEFATSSAGSDVTGFLAGGELKNGSQQYSKVSLVFKEAQDLKRVEFVSCEKELKDGVDFFFDPGFRRAYVEGGVKKFKVDVPGEAVRSLAIVFGRNQDFCVKDFKFVPRSGKGSELSSPKFIDAKIKPSAENNELFDSRPQTVPSDMKETTIELASSQTFDRVRLWQSVSGEPAKGFSIGFDGAAAYAFETATSTGVQEFKFEKPVTAKKIVLKAKDGKLGELRFANGDEEFIPTSFFGASEDGKEPTQMRKIASTSFASMLDRELVSRLDDKETWIFRFRSDGTFFMRGYGDDISEARAFSALGSYTIEKPTKTGARLQLHGIRVPTALAWDGVLCPFECGGAIEKKTQMVSDVIELEEAKAGAVMVRNRAPVAKRTIPFSDLKSQNSAFED